MLEAPLVAWVQQAKVTASDGAASDQFGKAVALSGATALSGETALVGAPADDDAGTDSGSVSVFVRSGTTWRLQQKLVAGDGASGDSFGAALAVSGETALIGAPGDDGGGRATDTGSAYVFTRTAGIWTERAKLVASPAAAGDRFGAAVALSGSNAVIGAPFADNGAALDAGAAFTFQGSGAAWAAGPRLAPTSGNDDHTGSAVAISGARLALGTDRTNGYVISFYDFVNGAWLPSAGGVSSTSPGLAHLGAALAMSAKYTVVGGYGSDVTSTAPVGTAFVVQNDAHATQVTLKPSDGAAGDQFGSAVAISEADAVFVASNRDDDKAADSGSTYVFGFTTSWTQQQKLTASDGAAGDAFGSALAVSNGFALLGAPLGANKAGAVYVSTYANANGTACSESSDCGSGFCVEGVCCNSACNGTCQSCLQKNKGNGSNGGPDGSCGNVRGGNDPYDQCQASDPDQCGLSGQCDGKGACALYSAGSSCTYSACAGPTTGTLNSACNGLGACKPVATVPCELGYECVSGTCKSGCNTNSDCDAALGFICSETKDCKKPKGSACASDSNCTTGACQWGFCCLPNADGVCIKPLGTECALGSECASTVCSDGVCCSSSCGGPCESCALPNSKGTCAAAPEKSTCPTNGGAGGDTGAGGNTGMGGDAAGGAAQGGFSTGGSMSNGGTSIGGTSISGQSSVAGSSQGGGTGRADGGASGSSSNGGRGGSDSAGQSGATGAAAGMGLGCTSDAQCARGLACDPVSHTCQDQLVRACGCRTAGGGERDALAPLGLLGAACLMRARRRSRSRAQ